jgi:DNA processing protein
MPRGNLEDWVALSLLPCTGPILLRRALARYGDPGQIAHRLSPNGWLSLRGVGPGCVEEIRAARKDLRKRAEREIRRCERRGIRLITTEDEDYPAALEELPDAPVLLYLRGSLPERIVRVAVVGSRRATAYGRRIAAGLGSSLAARGIEVVSGGARGVDTLAHRGALETGGRTTAVLGSGFLNPYPAENEDLFEKIAERGAVLSEFELRTAPRAENFPRRNRLISGLATAVVVVEATPRSGSLITVSHALEQGREVLAVPGPVSSEQSQGCHRLIQQGAKLVQEVEDILAELSPMYTAALPLPGRGVGLGDEKERNSLGPDEDEAKILEILSDDPEPVHLDALADRAPFGVARLQAALFGLELKGLVEQIPGRYYLCRPSNPDPPREGPVGGRGAGLPEAGEGRWRERW